MNGTHHHDDHDTMGLHGMLLFGDEVLYLSHLPMFGAPHNFQVLIEIGLDSSADAVLRADRDAGHAGIYTFKPTPFPMSELEPNGQQPARTSIDGQLVRGHFEHGGQTIADDAVAHVRRVVYFRELDVTAAPGDTEQLTYLCLGFTGRMHLVHQIGARPSFDQVLTGRLVAGTVRDQAGRRMGDDAGRAQFETAERLDTAQLVTFRGRGDAFDERLTPGAAFDGLFPQEIGPGGSHGFTAGIEIDGEIYVEHGELA